MHFLCVSLLIATSIYGAVCDQDITIIRSSLKNSGWTKLIMKCFYARPEGIKDVSFNITLDTLSRAFMSVKVHELYNDGYTYVVENTLPIDTVNFNVRFSVLYKSSTEPSGTCSDLQYVVPTVVPTEQPRKCPFPCDSQTATLIRTVPKKNNWNRLHARLIFEILSSMPKVMFDVIMDHTDTVTGFMSTDVDVANTNGNTFTVKNIVAVEPKSFIVAFSILYKGDVPSIRGAHLRVPPSEPTGCSPNGTLGVENPNNVLFDEVFAMDMNHTICDTTWVDSTKEFVIVSGCPIDKDILVHFSDRYHDPEIDLILIDGVNYIVRCNQINATGVNRTFEPELGVSLQTENPFSVTPTFGVNSALRDSLGNIVSTANVGDVLEWTIDIPVEYFLLPLVCTAYGGSDNTVPSWKEIIVDGCTQDDSLVKSFNPITQTSDVLNHIVRYYTDFYVFKFYDSNDIFLECQLRICPPQSPSCDMDCGNRKRRSINYESLVERAVSQDLLHISQTRLPTGNAAVAVPSITSCMVWASVAYLVWSRQ